LSAQLYPGQAVKANHEHMDEESRARFGSAIHFVAKVYSDTSECEDCGSTQGLDIIGDEYDDNLIWCTCAWRPLDDGDIAEIKVKHSLPQKAIT